MRNTRIRVPETAAAGDIVEIRAMIMHPMDNGFTYTTQGTLIPVDIVTDFTCTYLDEEVVHVRLEPGISANPYFSFRLRALRTGKVEFAWVDQHGEKTVAEALLTVK
ncbi:thiosulfate oxidation carrier complex protein SoxZ [Pseudaminobacter sp. 19-2017]|uniref:Thiosulfate oxidation carrier complex protein SoxZ n=1 Tax=Pseudaminobacter soli (ex Zhang et al. 2022) TaxID=2831468 RepID=A0A942E293_9HYPH|nr:thiosulfate oxidation carrier complex protein SoxZ [Pseudaminobacter soli]MBS3647217.1 thiosulfate oxidation carrier complex protein SoxZ [Pseudaminobacter soli]